MGAAPGCAGSVKWRDSANVSTLAERRNGREVAGCRDRMGKDFAAGEAGIGVAIHGSRAEHPPT